MILPTSINSPMPRVLVWERWCLMANKMLMSEKKKKCMTKIFGLLLSVINPPHILSFFLWFGIFAYLLYVIYMLGSAPGVTLKKLIFFAHFPTSFIQVLPLFLSLLPPLSISLTSFSPSSFVHLPYILLPFPPSFFLLFFLFSLLPF